jgi:DNA-binding XRE family transcriptional regulator
MNAVEIGNKLKNLRGETPMQVVADAIRISKSALGMYETGKRIPRDEIKQRLSSYYEQTIEDIFFAE